MGRIGIILLLSLVGCGSWETAKETDVLPLNELLHHQLPRAMASGDEAVIALHTGEEAAADLIALRGRFESVARARCLIVALERDGDEATVKLALEVVGIADGAPHSVHQRRTARCTREGEWLIASASVQDERVFAGQAGRARFVDETAARGPKVTHHAVMLEGKTGKVLFVAGSGVAAGDLDGDGHDDAVLTDGRSLRLYLNRGGKLVDASKGLPALPQQKRRLLSVLLIADLDGDGDEDLFVGAIHGQPLLLSNRGDATFELVRETGIVTKEMIAGACLADFDGDGLLDLYLANNADLANVRPAPMGNPTNGTPNQLWRNRGDWRFEDVSEKAGVVDTGWGLACAAADVDGDGDIDLFLGNDFGPDRYYRNRGDGTFDEVADELGLDRPAATMSVSWGDADGDGDLDLFVAGMASDFGWTIEQPEFPSPAPWFVDMFVRGIVKRQFRAFFRGNRYYRNKGDGSFEEVAADAGTANSGWAWATLWLDYDNDGQLDLYGCNGFVTGEDPEET